MARSYIGLIFNRVVCWLCVLISISEEATIDWGFKCVERLKGIIHLVRTQNF